MVEPKKGTKQATINAFFSPKKPGQESDDKAAESELKSVGAKRPRATSPAANSEAATANSSDKTEKEESAKPQAKKKVTKAKAKPKAKAKGKAKASPKPKKKRKQRQPVRFTSPHAVAMGEDEEEDEDLDYDNDVFNTPESKRARAELETGGEIVPAGTPISDDAVVNEEEIVDVSEDDAATMTATEISADGEDALLKVEAATGEAVVDLTAASAPNSTDEPARPATETDGSKKARGKAATSPAARTPAAKNSKASAKTTAKRQQKMKEKAAAAAAEAKPAPVEPLDPVIQARVDTYKMKTDELTRLYTELWLSKQESDAIMQDIYGARLDCDLDVTVGHEKAQQALAETWQKLRDHAHSTSNATDAVALPVTVDFPHEVKCLIVKGIQGRTASLSVVSRELLAAFKKDVEANDVDMEATEKTSGSDIETVDQAASLAMEMDIKMLAQRTPHGVRPAKANVFEDTSVDALWVWEVGSLEKYFGEEAQKTVKRMRKHRKRLGQQLKTLARVVQLLHQKPVDEAKVSAEEVKVGKFGFVVDAELQKAKDREAKEQEKRHAVEEKKRLDLERQEAKNEEKRKRDREVEEKELESFKAQKKFKSFFATAAANGTGTSDAVIDMTGDHDMEKSSDVVESKSAKIASMDAAISFLGSSGGTSSSSTGAAGSSHQSIFSSLKNKRDATRNQTNLNSSLGWSDRRHRDPKLGVMKLLQFYENNRPAYYGTFSARSRLFHGGRRPFTQYSKFDYSVDSDDEWEEEEPGESLSDDDNDGEESDEDNLDYDDQWLAYEDEVDYMDDIGKEVDPMERGEGPSSPTKHKLPSQLQKKRVKTKTVKPAKLEPQIIGPFWCGHNGSDDSAEGHFPGLAGELMCEPVFESTLIRKAREYEEEQKRIEAAQQEQQRKKEQQQELKAQEKKAQEAKTSAAAKLAAVKKAATAETKKTGKATPQKAAAKPAVVTKTSTTETKKTTKTMPQKVKTQKASVKQNPAASAKSTPAAAPSSPSPAKAPKQIDSWFKKVSGPVPTPPKTQQSHPQQADEQKPKEGGSVEAISVD